MRRHTLALAILATLASSASLAASSDPRALLIEQGNYWQSKKNPERALESWQKLLSMSPEQPDALYGIGLVQVQQQHPEEAQKYLARLRAISPLPRQALQLEQDIAINTPANARLLEQARELGEPVEEREKAVALYRQIFQGRQPQGLIAREYYNVLAFTPKGTDEGISGLQRVTRERPDDAIAALFLARHLTRNPSSRVEGIRAMARLSTDNDVGGAADEGWRFALVWLGAPKSDQVPLFQQFLAKHPDDTEIRALMNKGIAQDKGVSGWQRDPKLVKAFNALDEGDLKTAEPLLAARLAEKSNDMDALGGMGVLRQQQQRFSEAENYLAQATRLPGGTAWQKALSDVRYWRLLNEARDAQAAGRSSQALDLAAQAERLNPGRADATVALAGFQAQDNQLDASEATYRKVLARNPGDPDALSGLIGVLSQSGRPDEALKLIDSVPPADRAKFSSTAKIKAMRATQLGKLADQRGDLKAAQAAYQQALDADPENPWTRFALARVYLRDGQIRNARALLDGLLKSQPNQPDALYTSTLLSVELDEWKAADATLSRIPAGQRTPDMNELANDIALHKQTEIAIETARRGQRPEALALLGRSATLAGKKLERLAVLASAYVDVGAPEEGLQIMQDVLQKTSTPTADQKLLYASVLLKANHYTEAGEILRDLQGQPLNEAGRQRYEDLIFQYRVKQADALREKNDLVAAYDMLSPALVQRPHDTSAIGALARMYAAGGDGKKAMELYRPLVQQNPDNARLQLGLADIALKGGDRNLAQSAVDKALTLEPGSAEVLTSAAGIYRGLGRNNEATELLRRALAIENAQRVQARSALADAQGVTYNPFVGLPGQRRQITDLAVDRGTVPPPIDAPASVMPGPVAPGIAATAVAGNDYAPSNGLSGPFVPPTRIAALDNPTLSPAQRALDSMLRDRSGYLVQGLSVRSNNGESGLSRMTDVETPFEARMPVGDYNVALRVTPVSLSSGSVKAVSDTRFGTGSTGGAGSQRENGVGLAVAVENPGEGLKADIGVSPLGFTYDTVVGGASVSRPFTEGGNLRYGVNVSRRPVTDSVTSFAGSEDKATGRKWGGVTANGGRGELSYDNQEVGAYGYASLHQLLGNNVEANTRMELGSGVYWYLRNTPTDTLTLGVSGMAMGFKDNQGFYTYGNGGYFSPQRFFSLAVPVRWAQSFDRFSYELKSSVGVQHIAQDGADYFPTDSRLQANAPTQRYDSSSKTGIGYSLNAAAEYRLTSRFYLGGEVGVDNAQDYRQYVGNAYLRYLFEDLSGPMPLPVSPYRSPYSN
ncbi:Tetratricopeptide repeat-containing protein [Pseudomonas cedrina]|uniref:Cellulose synthase n=2 Tax=Pseudomonas cedrina TaxID=651740 RepID=A0A1V2K9E8_PSECE|nr:cellulose biosynthesis protein BcsC [Pseudomonas cedrina]ONH54328.1 cellulose synthase [Pseudomonas cedrina subsp. cedrina]SDT61532.1 Tetratricopeptide repeat-containing protein [Pseudomonas cedrina]